MKSALLSIELNSDLIPTFCICQFAVPAFKPPSCVDFYNLAMWPKSDLFLTAFCLFSSAF